MEIYAAVNAVREERAGDAEDKLLDSQLALSDPIAIGSTSLSLSLLTRAFPCAFPSARLCVVVRD
jgi:hypothetical protein